MPQAINDNDTIRHNATITPHPATLLPILFPATGPENDGWVIRMGDTGPQFIELSSPPTATPVPGWANWGLEPIECVRRFIGAFLRVGTPEHAELERSTTVEDRDTLHALLQLRAIHATLPVALTDQAKQTAITRAAARLIPDPRLRATFRSGQLPAVGEWFHLAFTNRELRDVRLVLWWTKDRQFIPAISCPTMKAAMFAFAAFRGVAACRNCGELFTMDTVRADKSKSEKYCLTACGNRYRQKTYRVRLEEIESKNPKKH